MFTNTRANHMSQSRIDMFRDCWVIRIVSSGISLCATFCLTRVVKNRSTHLIGPVIECNHTILHTTPCYLQEKGVSTLLGVFNFRIKVKSGARPAAFCDPPCKDTRTVVSHV